MRALLLIRASFVNLFDEPKIAISILTSSSTLPFQHWCIEWRFSFSCETVRNDEGRHSSNEKQKEWNTVWNSLTVCFIQMCG